MTKFPFDILNGELWYNTKQIYGEFFQNLVNFLKYFPQFKSIMRYSLLDFKRDHVEQNAHNDVNFIVTT